MLRINCFFKANEGKYAEALEAALALTAASRADKGCVSYDTFESATQPDVFLICETWTDAEALASHMAADHFSQYVGQLKELGLIKIEQFDFPAK